MVGAELGGQDGSGSFQQRVPEIGFRLIKDGQLTVIDFKTDRIKPGEEARSAARYRPQLDAYSLALERIFSLPVKSRILYFFSTETTFVL